MANYLQIQINNSTGLSSAFELYLFIIGEVGVPGDYNYYSYELSSDGNLVATQGADNVVTAIPLSSLGVDPNNSAISYFNFDQSEAFSGRIWFSTSKNLLSISSLQVNQPNPSSGMLFDFTELTINAGQNVNCDTTQVVGLGIPITIVNSEVLSFPPSGDNSNYTYPNAIGIVPGNSLSSICESFTEYVNAIGLTDFTNCVQTYPAVYQLNPVQWLMNPGSSVPDFETGTAPTGLSTSLDSMINAFFDHFSKAGNQLQITFNSVDYTGTVVTKTGFDPANSTVTYCVLNLVDANKNSFPIFYPYFNTNSILSQTSPFNPYTSLPEAPSWWKKNNLPSAMPASGQAFLCEGVFNDGNPNAPDLTILAALQNIVVSMINRGLIPGETMNNLFACTGNLALTAQTITIQDQNPAASSTIDGASLIYAPSQIPNGTLPGACSATGSIQLVGENADGTTLTQTFSDNVVTLPATPDPTNYCTESVATQLNADGDVQFVFQYENAVWPTVSGVQQSPVLVAPIAVTYETNPKISQTATFTTTDSLTGITDGMNVFDLNVQNPATVLTTGTGEFTIQSTINGIIPSPTTDTLIVGNFYPTSNGQALGSWNAYAAFLHYGGNNTPAPYISNQGYAFAYDDDGGYSSDITVNFTAGENCKLGIYLGPLY